MLTSFIRPDAEPASYKTSEQLRYIIDNRENYLPESVLAAVDVLQGRGVEFSDEELQVIREDMQARTEIASDSRPSFGLFADNYKNVLVKDPDAYEFYSRRVIKAFTFFFGPVFGSVMMAMNIGKTGDNGGVALVLAFGVGVNIVEGIIAGGAGIGSSITVIFSFVNMALMDALFWNKYIGNTTLYKARKYWVPLAIGVILLGLVIWAIFSGTIPVK